ncbi:hypothetical protein D9M71_610740 [compost metagenome]
MANSCLSGDKAAKLSAESPSFLSPSIASPPPVMTASPILSPMSLKILAILSPLRPARSAAYCHCCRTPVPMPKDFAQRSVSVVAAAVFFSITSEAVPTPRVAVTTVARAPPIFLPASSARACISFMRFSVTRPALSMPCSKPPMRAIKSSVRVPSERVAMDYFLLITGSHPFGHGRFE